MTSAYLLVTLGAATVTAAPERVEGVWTHWPVDIVGPTSLLGTTGAVFFDGPTTLEGTRLKADEVVVNFAWEKGVHARGDRSLVNHVTDRGNDSFLLEGIDISFGPFGGSPLLLASSDKPMMQISATSQDGMTLLPSKGERIVSVGTTSDTVSAGENPAMLGYAYSTDGPIVKGRAEGVVLVEGSFDLFVHNVQIQAGSHERDWPNWTGYWESEPGAAVTEYELRITTISVRNGTFSNIAEDARFFLSKIDVQVDGSVTSTDVTGRIRQSDSNHIFDRDRFRLEGAGSITAEAIPVDATPSVLLRPTGGFEMSGASSVETLPSIDHPGGSSGIASIASFGALGLLTVIGLMVFGVVPAPTAGSRSHQYDLWMRQGDRAAEGREWRRASRCYRRAARSRRHDPSALFEGARAEIEAGEPVAAERLALRASALPDMDRADALELLVWTAHLREDDAAVEGRLVELAELAPETARQVASDLGFDRSRIEHLLIDDSPGRDHAEGLDGYA